ncbi:MAG: PAS domain S-box protein [Propionibacteriaceae bacterium]
MSFRAPNDLYRQIVESAREGIWIHDLAGRTTYANTHMAQLLGYSVAEMSGVTIFDLLDPPGQQQAAAMLERERAAPLSEQVDCRYVRKDGSNVWCLVNRSPLFDEAGQHIGCINLISDITERKQLDEQLRRNSELLAEAQRVAHLGSWGWDVANDLIDWSDEMYLILGLPITGEQLTFSSYLDRVHPDDRDMVIGLVSGGVDGEPTFTYDCRVIRANGDVAWIHAEGETSKDELGTVRTMRGTMLDITAYKEAVQEVERTSARYQLLQRMATEANKDSGFEHVLGIAVEQILLHTRWPVGRVFLVSGDPPQLALDPLPSGTVVTPSTQSPDDPPREAVEGCRTALAGRVLASGRPVWLSPVPVDGDTAEATCSPFPAGFAFPVLINRDVVAVLEFLSDRPADVDQELLETCEQVGTQLARVAQRQQAAADLAAARDSAMESVRVKSEFLATMSHEIRTPMNGVIGLTHLLLDTELDARQRQYAEGVQVSGEVLLSVINDILDFSKLEAGKVELDREDFEVRRVVEEVTEMMAPTAYGKGLELLAHCSPDVPAVLVGDSGRIRQILLNLVSNGVKFSTVGEVVTKVTSVPLANGGVQLRFQVTDTGIGIPEESRSRLFESFSQADASTTRRYGGTGLGLAISQRLVEAMGGSIGFDSEVDRGSTFWFEVPLQLGTRRIPSAARPSDPNGAIHAPHPVARRQTTYRGHVLVVEDNPLNQLVAEGIVTSLGCSVDIVANGAEALRAILHTSYAAVLMDCHMPVLDGFETTRELRRREGAGVRMPVVAMTAGAMAEDRERCADAGMDDFISKPVTLAAVETALSRWITPHRDESLRPTPESAPDEVRPAWADEPALDLNRIAQLRQLGSMGGTDLLGRVVRLFTRDGSTSVAAIRQAAATESWAELHAGLHKLRGTSANMGANRVAAICRQLEEETQDAAPTLSPDRLDELELELAHANRAIAQVI